jgi:hypothetical protein
VNIKVLTHEEFDRRVQEAMKPPKVNPANKAPIPSKQALMAANSNSKILKME